MVPSTTSRPVPVGGRPRGRQPRLERGRSVEVALELLDNVGLEALTMRRLADALDVQAGALYRYFATKEELLTAMAELMLAGCGDLPADVGPADRPAALARRLRAALLAHRDGARVYAGTHSIGPHTLGFADAMVGALGDFGHGPDDAARAAYALIHFTVGHTLEEQAILDAAAYDVIDEDAVDDVAAAPAGVERLRQALEPQRYPHLAAAASALTTADYGSHFDYGLAVFVRGLRPAP
ncbi:TetR/AcrR family transcriptional regulator C-terminal domain-containing protein [Actinoplanes sp. NPDC049265]|uniref:TetR/AcrR family transcriptional regulator C-terminal domain-containing protein n=1 Tax=Actinoplanes sp. NPDC049265 TaxID=3363902 RepID=UPI003718A3CA